MPIWQWLGPLAPALLLLLIFFAGPIIWAVYISFTNKALTGIGRAHPKWVGLSNFTHMFNDPLFIHSLVLTLIFVVGSAVIGQNTLGLPHSPPRTGEEGALSLLLSTPLSSRPG